MTKRNLLGFCGTILSLGLLIPGLTFPMFHLRVSGELRSQFANISGDVMNTTRSILGTVDELYSQERILVAALILLFSAVVPVIKAAIVLFALFSKDAMLRAKLHRFVNTIAKWSMADVFVVAILLAFLSTTGHMQRTTEQIAFLGMKIPVQMGLLIDSQILSGFYYFLGYCLVSLAAVQLIRFTKVA